MGPDRRARPRMRKAEAPKAVLRCDRLPQAMNPGRRTPSAPCWRCSGPPRSRRRCNGAVSRRVSPSTTGATTPPTIAPPPSRLGAPWSADRPPGRTRTRHCGAETQPAHRRGRGWIRSFHSLALSRSCCSQPARSLRGRKAVAPRPRSPQSFSWCGSAPSPCPLR
jgi:hypothetical protein